MGRRDGHQAAQRQPYAALRLSHHSIRRKRGISGRRKRKYVHTTNSNHAFPIADNVLQRDFAALKPNQKWVGDITYLPTHEGWLYLAVLVDLFSRKIVGWAVSRSMHTKLPLGALQMALLRRRPQVGLIHHTDRGCQYASSEYRQALQKAGIVCSMIRRSDCWDNAAGESVFARIKDDLAYRTSWQSQAQGRAAVEYYIENFYNPLRRHSSAGYLSPDQYEKARQLSRRAA